jgi:hypothetical protein
MKQNQYRNTFFSCITACVAALTIMTSCDTEYNTTYVSGDAYIKSFTIQAFEDQQPIQAAIVNDTIKVLWTSYHEVPKTITPVIELADKAAISPKAAVEIPFKTGEKYTVTSEAGTTKQYTLQVDLRQPQPRTFVNPANANGTLGGSYASAIGSQFGGIDNFWFNLEQTRVYLVSAADQTTEYDCEIAYLGEGNGIAVSPFRNAGIYCYLPTNIPVGKYDFRIKNGEYILRDSREANRFNYTITEPTVTAISSYTNGFTVAKGGTFSIRGTKLDVISDLSIATSTSATAVKYSLEIVSRTSYSATFKVPTDIPAAAYGILFYKNESGTQVFTGLSVTVKD